MKKRFAAGIDPGQVNGFALWDRQAQKLIELESYTFWNLILRIQTLGVEHSEVFVEDPSKNSFIYGRHWEDIVGKVARSSNPGFISSELRKFAKMAQNVGGNKQDALRIIEYVDFLGLEHHEIAPNRKMQKFKAGDMAAFGWQGRSNQHTRDAARLVVGL